MRITIESTDKVVELIAAGLNGAPAVFIEARIWQGQTDSGIPVQVFVTRIAPEVEESDPRVDELTEQFALELRRTAAPRATVAAIPLRLIL
jgi:hypothetical protein